MAADPKILDRIDKLIRLAAPTSGSTYHERASAALEIVRLMLEHGVELRPAEVEQGYGDEKAKVGVWVPAVAPYHVDCVICHNLISPHDRVWARVFRDRSEYRHNFTCGMTF